MPFVTLLCLEPTYNLKIQYYEHFSIKISTDNQPINKYHASHFPLRYQTSAVIEIMIYIRNYINSSMHMAQYIQHWRMRLQRIPMTVAVHALLYGCENWVPSREVKWSLYSAEMKFIWKFKGCVRLNKLWNEDIRQDFWYISIHAERQKPTI